MLISARVARPLFYLAIASAAVIAAGCAGTPQNTSSQTPAETPASVSKLVDTADFTKQAQDQGWEPVVRNGQVLYCKDETPIGSLLPEKTCLNKVGVYQMMLAEERQRENMQQHPAGKIPGS